jgi:hypothetical protein
VIFEERDVAWWRSVGEHPAVKPHVGLGRDLDFALVSDPVVTPLRSENGGFLFLRLDGLGRVQELHTLYRPEGWGKEVLAALKAAVAEMFARGAQLITTHEVEGYYRSRPPKTFRFEPCGDFAPVAGFAVSTRTWVLRREAWEASPARQRM